MLIFHCLLLMLIGVMSSYDANGERLAVRRRMEILHQLDALGAPAHQLQPENPKKRRSVTPPWARCGGWKSSAIVRRRQKQAQQMEMDLLRKGGIWFRTTYIMR